MGNISAAELSTAAGVADLTKNTFLQRVCFNYDRGIDAGRRLQIAFDELEAGKIKRLRLNEFPSVKDLVGNEFHWEIPYHITLKQIFDSENQQPKTLLEFHPDLRWLHYTQEVYEKQVFPLLVVIKYL